MLISTDKQLMLRAGHQKSVTRTTMLSLFCYCILSFYLLHNKGKDFK